MKKQTRTAKYLEENFWLKPSNQFWNRENSPYSNYAKEYLNNWAESTKSQKVDNINAKERI